MKKTASVKGKIYCNMLCLIAHEKFPSWSPTWMFALYVVVFLCQYRPYIDGQSSAEPPGEDRNS